MSGSTVTTSCFAADTVGELLDVVELVLEKLERVNIRLNNRIACITEKIRFLGAKLSKGELSIPEHSVQAFMETEPPRKFRATRHLSRCAGLLRAKVYSESR